MNTCEDPIRDVSANDTHRQPVNLFEEEEERRLNAIQLVHGIALNDTN
jgi:hypothetical protein